MYLYKSYCYADLQSVKSSIQSNITLDGFGLLQSVDVISVDKLGITYQLPDGTQSAVVYTAPSCDRLGFDNSYTGLTVSDSVDLSMMVLLVLITAWSMKVLRRAL